MDIKEAKKVLIDYATKRIKEIDKIDMPVRRFYFDERKSMDLLIEILQFSI